MRRRGAVKGDDGRDKVRPGGLGCVIGEYVATLAHVGKGANAVWTAADLRELSVERLSVTKNLALFGLVGTERPEPTAELAAATTDEACAIAAVRDDAPQLRLIRGRAGRIELDGRFTVELDGVLPEDHSASGSPVVSADGAVIGIVGGTYTTNSVPAFGLSDLERLIASRLGESDALPLDVSATTRSALGYALALTSGEGSRAIGAAGALLLGTLRSAADDPGQTVPQDLLAFIAKSSAASGVTLVEATVKALGPSVPHYPPDPPDDSALRGSVIAPLLAEAEALRGRLSRGQRLHRRYLLAAALTQPPNAFPPSLFETLGVPLPEMRGALRESILDRPDAPLDEWDEVLSAPPLAPFELAGGISRDLVDPTEGIPLERDHLGVRDYVTMFATVIADKETKPPLSIGLFGEWGSGKSYFMALLRAQVAALASSEPPDPRYHQEIVQIGFNAWHYADSNLWASLGDEIFEQLAGPGETTKDRRKRLHEELAERLQLRQELEAASNRAREETVRLTHELDKATVKRETSAVALVTAVLDASAVQGKLGEAWTRMGVTDELEQGRLLADELSQTPQDVATLSQALRGGWRGKLLLAGLVIAAAAITAGVLVSREWLAGSGLAILGGVLTVVGWLAVRVRSGARLLHEVADRLRRETDDAVAEELAQLRRAEAEQRMLETQLDQVMDQVGELGRELAELGPGQRLYTFIAERATSDDYRRQLGLISTIRKDFEQLIVLMKEWQHRERSEEDADAPKAIDRIVLYIDDLDRCSSEQVVDVLQAVHLLLALDLFVVVVGVDPRWLLRSLRREYRTILTSGSQPSGQTSLETTPQDYLEKIFNIPFTLPRMRSDSFEQLVRSLVEIEIETDTETAAAVRRPPEPEPAPVPAAATDGETPAVDLAELPAEAESEVATLQGGANRSEARPLTAPELRMLTALAPLVETPRETKRLLNLYRMIRATRNLSPASRFLGDDSAPGEYQAVVILLGLLSGHARLLESVLAAPTLSGVRGGLVSRPRDELWPDFVAGMQPREGKSGWENDVVGPIPDADVESWRRLASGLADASALVTIPDLAPFQLWAPRIARFSFLLSPFAQEQ